MGRAPIGEVQFGIVGPGNPGGTSATLPGITGPGFAARFPVTWHGVEAPDALACVGIVSIHKTACAKLRPRDAHQNLVLYDQRNTRGGEPFLGVGNLPLPQHGAGAGVKGNQRGLDVHLKKFVAQRCEAPVHLAATHAQIRRRGFVVMPELPPSEHVDCVTVVRRPSDKHHSAENQRRGFVGAPYASLENPAGGKTLDILRVDLVDQR